MTTNSPAYMRVWRYLHPDRVRAYRLKHMRKFLATRPGYNARKIRECRARKAK